MKVIDKYTKDEARFLKIGICVSLVLAAVTGYLLLSKAKIENAGFEHNYPIKATFGRTDGLLIGDKVRVAGIEVGRVTEAAFDDKFHAILTLSIKDNVKIPDDSSASIVSYSLMGPKYIEIEPGGSEDYLAPNDEFAYTQDALVLEELISRIIDMGKASRNKEGEI